MLEGDYESALEDYTQESDPEWLARGTSMAAFSLGKTADYEKALEELKQGWGEQWPSEVAAVYIWAGDYDAAFEWLEKSIAIKESQVGANQFDPMLSGIHEDPRWLPFLERIGRSPAQLDAIEFNVTLPDQ